MVEWWKRSTTVFYADPVLDEKSCANTKRELFIKATTVTMCHEYERGIWRRRGASAVTAKNILQTCKRKCVALYVVMSAFLSTMHTGSYTPHPCTFFAPLMHD